MEQRKVVKKAKRTLSFMSASDLEETAAAHVVNNLNEIFTADGNVMDTMGIFLETRCGIHEEQWPSYERHVRQIMAFIVNRGVEQYATQFDEVHGRQLNNEIECSVDEQGESVQQNEAEEEHPV